MLRTIACLMLLPVLALAAPLPNKNTAAQKYLEQLWAEMDSSDYVIALSAAYRLHHRPGAVEFLATKLPPIRADKDETIRHLKALDSEDEKEWIPALEELRYHHPGLSHPFKEQLEYVTTTKGQERLLKANDCYWNFYGTDTLTMPIRLQPWGQGGNQEIQLVTKELNRNGFTVQPAADSEVDMRRQLCLLILNQFQTEKSQRVLAGFVEGHQTMKITTYAKKLIQLKPAVLNFKHTTDSIHKVLQENGIDNSYWVMLELDQQPKLEELLQDTLIPIAISVKDHEVLMKELVAEDEKTWKPACKKLQLFHPLLNYTADELCNREWPKGTLNRFYSVMLNTDELAAGNFDSISFDGIIFSFQQNKRFKRGLWVRSLRDFNCATWNEIRLLLPVLAQRNSPAGRKLIEQVAKGHTDIQPTREAKALLK